ncbi:FecR domain-containing protein [Ectopseudomonas hydrolytica]|uniref:FecR domain-containing protein n=1 Tax=Ectopseudomonas hydrolytica TaxID=2493633 RepID=A0ABY5A176_9GAMM|nr:FecR domain-containing protein [Pseudomonas hydrolytica]OCX15312.1 iron dicitrate transport regulator FecR [Stutzerimonas xanthomarina]USR37642.1 FecR domain-containing protein [Pseudomonas hydrolytica]
MSRTTPGERPATPEEDALARHREELQKRFPLPELGSKPRKRSKALGAVLLVTAIAGGLAWLDPAYQREQRSTAVGERQPVELADGSRLLLDSDSRIEITWHLLSRRVALQRGQALFDIAPASYRPFLVDAGTTRVKVLGTLFNVRRLEGDVRVTLARGKVEVEAHGDPRQRLQLAPGQQVDSRQGVLQEVVAADTEATFAWKESRLVFERTPLSEALALLQHYRSAPIRLEDPDLGALPITGVFDSDRVDDLLSLLPNILPVGLHHEVDGSVRVVGRPEK